MGEIQWNESEIKYRILKSRLQRTVRKRCIPLGIVRKADGVVYGVFAMMEKEKNYLLAKISLAAAGILLLVWVLMIVFAL